MGIIEEDGAGVVTRTLLPVQDGLGNITAVIDQATGRTVAHYDYGPFGEPLAESGEVDACPFRWQTKWYDAESQHYYFGYRHYDPRFGRWLSRDPLGEAGGFNLYAYCGNDPVNQHDPLGLADRSIRPYGWFQLMFPATTGRDDLKGVACEGGLYGVYGILSTPSKIAAHPKIQGSLRMAGGGLEVGVGAVYSFGTEGIGAPLGGFALMANGADNFIAGFQSFRMGAYQPALLERGITSVAGNGWVGNGLYMATQLGVGFAPAIGARTERLALLLDWNPVFAPYRGGYAYSGVPLPGMPVYRTPAPQLEFGFVQAVERQTVARDFYRASTGWDDTRIASHLRGIDFSQPVGVVNIQAGTSLTQYNLPGRVGNYFAPAGTPANSLGIYTSGLVESSHTFGASTPALRSTAASVIDDWSMSGAGWRIETGGGGTQFFAPNR